MNHEPYIRKVPGSKTVLLCIHGIVGTPRHFDFLMPCVPESWSVCNILLDGHGKTVKEFGETSMEKWKDQVHTLFSRLCLEYESVVIAAHSMGTLFSLELATLAPNKVRFLFLLNVPLFVHLRPVGIRNNLLAALGRIDAADPVQKATLAAAGLTLTPKLWQYLPWLPRYGELLKLIGESRSLLWMLEVPCYAFQSRKDELVRNRSAKLLLESGKCRVTELPHSGHYYYTQEDQKKITDRFRELCRS